MRLKMNDVELEQFSTIVSGLSVSKLIKAHENGSLWIQRPGMTSLQNKENEPLVIIYDDGKVYETELWEAL